MTEGPPPAKRGRHSTPVLRVTAEERVKQFSEDLYCDDSILFCKFRDHSVDYVRVDTIKDEIQIANTEKRSEGSWLISYYTSAGTLTSMARSRKSL